MRWRNQILALLCLIIFCALGVLYFRHWVVQKPFGIVLFIGEGLTPERVAATRLYAGADHHLALESFPAVAFLSNYSRDFAVPDEIAAATAIATGEKVSNQAAAHASVPQNLRTIVDLAREKGRTVGVVTDSRLTNPTCAAFYAGGAEGEDENARHLADGKKVELALGGGGARFLPEAKGGGRRDSRDLVLEMRRDGFEIVRSKAELENIPRWRRPRLLGLFSNSEMASAKQLASGSEQPTLADMTRRAIELLQWNPGGYLLLVDAGLMGSAARQNHGEETLAETLELDRAVAVAKSYTGENSLIVVTGNLGIGGLSLNGSPFRRDRGIAILGVNAAGEPALTWATGPNGPRSGARADGTEASPSDAGEDADNSSAAHGSREPAAAYAPVARSTVADVFAAGRGPGTEELRGCLDNTVLFRIIRDQL